MIKFMKIHSFTLIISLLFLTAHTSAGCPAMVIQHASTEVLKCRYSEAKPIGAVMEVIINYSNERHMGEQSAKNLKTNIFQFSDNKAACKKFVKAKTFCMNLSQWCKMAGNPPHGARFTVINVSEGKCPLSSEVSP
jgi:hypothetical protein